MTPNDPTQDQRFLLPRAVPPIRSTNPVLDEIDQAHASLSPGAQAAIEKARLPLAGGMPEPMPEMPATRFMPKPASTPLAAPLSPAETGHMAELNRLTAAPPSDPALLHTKANTGASGYQQIHNPFLRGLATVGNIAESTFFPRAAMLTPGTDLHHNMLVRQQAGIVKNDQGTRKAAADEEDTLAKAAEQESLPEFHDAQNEIARLRAENAGIKAAPKQGGSVHEDADGNYWVIHGDGTATQVAPQGQPLKAKGKEETGGTVHEDSEGNMWVVKGNGEAIPVKPKGEAATAAPVGSTPDAGATGEATVTPPGQLKGKPPAARVENAEQQFVDEYRKNNPKATVAQAQRAFKQNEQLPPQVDRGQNFVDPATHRLIRVEPGGAVPEGALTASTLSTLNAPTSTQRDAAGRAVTMSDLDARIREGLKDPEIAKYLGPVAGRLAEAQGKIGLLPKKVADFQNDLVSYGAFQAGLHPVRGIGALEYFDKVMNGLAQTPEELLGKLDSNVKTGQSVKSVGGVKEQPQAGGIVRARDPRGVLHEAPAGTALPAGWKLEGK